MLSVLMATKNRAESLRQVLALYCELDAPLHGWKVVVVDNGSRDDTMRVADTFTRHLPLTYVSENRPGKNAALRTGFAYTEGDLVIFSDDDILPCRDWLLRYERAGRELPAFDLFGGPITLRWPRPPETWMTASFEILIVCFSCTGARPEGPTNSLLAGGNFAVRRAVLSQESFNPEIGPLEGRSFAMGSEADLQARLGQRGCRKWWLQGATVEHLIRPEQMDRKWVLKRAVRYGRAQYRLSRFTEEEATRFFGAPRWAVRCFLKEATRFSMARIGGREEKAFEAHWSLRRFWGMMAEARKDNEGRRG